MINSVISHSLLRFCEGKKIFRENYINKNRKNAVTGSYKQGKNMTNESIPPTKKPKVIAADKLNHKNSSNNSNNKTPSPAPILNDDQTRKAMSVSVKDGIFASIFTGFTKSFISPLAIAMKASNTMVAAFSSVPDLISNIVQLLTISAVKKLHSRKQIIFYCALMQALVWLPIILVPLIAKDSVLLLLILVSITTTLSQFMQPLWNSLMGDIVPKNERGSFFGKRNVVVGILTFASTFIAGLVLNHYSGFNPLVGFAIIFSVAVAARSVSIYFKTKLPDIPMAEQHSEEFSLWQFIRRMEKTNYGLFVTYVCLMKFSVYIAAPFFAVYMLKDLHFSYLLFTIITSASLVANFLFMALWGSLIDRKGSRRVLYITGLLVPVVPVLWAFVAMGFSGGLLFALILAVEILSGIAWAGFDLGQANFIFDAVRPENRIRCIAYFNLLMGVSIFAGTSVGSLLVYHYQNAFPFSSILLVFIISGVLRLVVSLIFLPKLREVRLIELPLGHTLFHRILDIKPHGGFEIGIIDKGPKVHHTEQKKQQKVCTKKDQSVCLHGKGTVDILKENVQTEESRVHQPAKKLSQEKIDHKKVEEIVKEMQRGRFPQELKKQR
jgi:MFS family permease